MTSQARSKPAPAHPRAKRLPKFSPKRARTLGVGSADPDEREQAPKVDRFGRTPEQSLGYLRRALEKARVDSEPERKPSSSWLLYGGTLRHFSLELVEGCQVIVEERDGSIWVGTLRHNGASEVLLALWGSSLPPLAIPLTRIARVALATEHAWRDETLARRRQAVGLPAHVRTGKEKP
jgi:hypothetical protein